MAEPISHAWAVVIVTNGCVLATFDSTVQHKVTMYPLWMYSLWISTAKLVANTCYLILSLMREKMTAWQSNKWLLGEIADLSWLPIIQLIKPCQIGVCLAWGLSILALYCTTADCEFRSILSLSKPCSKMDWVSSPIITQSWNYHMKLLTWSESDCLQKM